MRKPSEKDLELLKKLVFMEEKQLHEVMATWLRRKYDNDVIVKKEYIVAKGNIPVALVAHMDTVYASPPKVFKYFEDEGFIYGLGFDDRAGIFAIIKIIQSGLRPSVILTTGEEEGGIGATLLTLDYQESPIRDLNFLIELDRRGTNDCVFYHCNNEKFIKFIEEYGFERNTGSYSDISFIMSQWKVCGVNISVGYYNEHSQSEILLPDILLDNIDIIKEILFDSCKIKKFKYMEDSCLNILKMTSKQ
jgi:putative aminopeptidase FrvX